MMRTTFLSHTVNHPGLFAALLWGLTVAVGTWPAFGGNSVADPKTNAVTYEAFGAVGDGVTDDLLAIRDAHIYANEHGQRVQSNPNATYHLGRRALTAIIATDTDWGTSRFIIDDSRGLRITSSRFSRFVPG